MNKTFIAAVVAAMCAASAFAQIADTNYAVRVPCEMQATAGESEPRLASLTWLQGTTPLVVAEPLRRGRAIPYDADTRVRMVIGPSATGALYAVRTNAAAVTNGYAMQWPTIGTNTAGAAWFYTILFDKDGRTYWTGSGDLYITATTSTASNGLEWIEYIIPSVGWGDIAGDPADNSALVAYVAEHSGGSADGSGFPLTNDVSAAGFDIQGMDEVVANSLYATNDASVRDLTVRRNISVIGNAEYAGDFVVSGNLTLIGSATNLNWVVVDNRTNVYGGTNYYETTVYATQVVYRETIVYTNVVTTNQVNTYVNENGTWVATNAEHVWLAHLYDYRDDKAYPVGTWNFSSAAVERITIPPDGLALASVAAFDAGVATIDLGSNWCWRLVADTDCTAINFSVASVPEGDIVPNTVKAILLEVSRGESAAWAWGGHLSHITNDAPAAGAVSHLLLIAPSQDVTATNGWTVF